LREDVMPDPRSLQIESLRAQLAEAEAALAQAGPAGVPVAEEIAPEPEPVQALLESEPEPVSMYDVPQDPAEALAGVLASGHEVGGYAGLGAAVSN
jgi:hypothetical protein